MTRFYLIILAAAPSQVISEPPPPALVPLDAYRGMVNIRVEVDGAENNPQTVMLDTGSKHSYLLSHRMMDRILQRTSTRGIHVAGIRRSLLRESELRTRASENNLGYAAFANIRLNGWTRKLFTMSNGHSWNQKFGIAEIDEAEIQRWFPSYLCGMIGASPDSRFARLHPHFGFIPRRVGNGIRTNLFLEPIRPAEWCRDQLVVRSPVVRHSSWTYPMWLLRTIRMDFLQPTTSNYIIAANYELLIDTGFSFLYLPTTIYYQVRSYILSLNIPTLQYPGYTYMTRYPTVQRDHVNMIPDLLITIDYRTTIRIPKERMTDCEDTVSPCRVLIGGGDYPVIALGAPLFSTLIVEYDASTAGRAQVGFCEPNAPHDAVTSPPLITFAGAPQRSVPPPNGHLAPPQVGNPGDAPTGIIAPTAPPAPPPPLLPPPLSESESSPSGDSTSPSPTTRVVTPVIPTPSPEAQTIGTPRPQPVVNPPNPSRPIPEGLSPLTPSQENNPMVTPYRPPQLPNDLVEDSDDDDTEDTPQVNANMSTNGSESFKWLTPIIIFSLSHLIIKI